MCGWKRQKGVEWRKNGLSWFCPLKYSAPEHRTWDCSAIKSTKDPAPKEEGEPSTEVMSQELRVIRICSKIHVFIFSFLGSLWVSPIVRDNVSSLMHPFCLTEWLGLEGNMKILIPVDPLAKQLLLHPLWEVGWEWGKGRATKVTSPRRNIVPGDFPGKNMEIRRPGFKYQCWHCLHGLHWTILVVSELCFLKPQFPWRCGFQWECCEKVATSIRLGHLDPCYSEQLFLSGWKVLHNILFEQSFLTLNLVKIR